MDYNFLDNSIDKENLVLPNSDKINLCLLKNHTEEIVKAIDFISSEPSKQTIPKPSFEILLIEYNQIIFYHTMRLQSIGKIFQKTYLCHALT